MECGKLFVGDVLLEINGVRITQVCAHAYERG